METGALNNLWHYIETLPLTSQNRQWLVDKLLSSKESVKKQSYDVLCERLDSLSKLPADWDDEGASAIDPSAISNAQALLDAATEVELSSWNLFPAIRCTVTFQHENVDALLSIGSDDYSFVYASDGAIIKAVDNAPFSVQEVLNLLKLVKGQKYA